MSALTYITSDVRSALANCNVANRVHALIAPYSTNFPYIVFQRDSVSGTYTKDGRTSETYTYTIRVVASTYQSSLEIAEEASENIRTISSTSINYSDVQILESSEYVEDDETGTSYVQNITVSFRAQYKI